MVVGNDERPSTRRFIVLLTITSEQRPATDLGYLLHKHPDNVRTVSAPFGQAHVFFPEATEQRCTAALMVEVDPVGLIRRRTRNNRESFALAGYVNDRPYAASSLLSVALGKVFRTAMTGRCDNRPELARTPQRFDIGMPVVPVRGGEPMLRSLFEPLGYEVDAAAIPLDETFPEWGPSRYLSVRLTGEVLLADLLSHLYVLLPVLDDDKHYWVGDDEGEKLLDKGGSWLASHPERDTISRRYLKHRRALADDVLARIDSEGLEPGEQPTGGPDGTQRHVEQRVTLNQQRLDAVVAAIVGSGAGRVLDLGCGEGRLIQALLGLPQIVHVAGADVSARVLERAAKRLHLDELSDRQRDRVALIHAGATYRDRRFSGFDAAALVEVIEHLDEARLAALEQVVFADAAPQTVVVTTPNREHNVRYEALAAEHFRHHDHRFEWTRDEFRRWSGGVATRCGYQVVFARVGPDDAEVGPPTQMAVFTR